MGVNDQLTVTSQHLTKRNSKVKLQKAKKWDFLGGQISLCLNTKEEQKLTKVNLDHAEECLAVQSKAHV